MNNISFERTHQTTEIDVNYLSTHNSYIPFYTLFNSKVYRVNEKKVIHYGILDFHNVSFRRYNTFTSIRCITYLSNQIQARLTYLYKESPGVIETVTINVGKGYIQDGTYNFLCLLVVESDYINNINLDNLNSTKFKFLISKELIDNPKYKKLWSTIKNKYLPLLKEDGIDIVYTNNLGCWAFNKKPMLPSFNTTEERNNYLNSINDMLEEISEVPTDDSYETVPLTQEEAENNDNNEDLEPDFDDDINDDDDDINNDNDDIFDDDDE